MDFEHAGSDSAVLGELGRRLARHRLNRNLTQGALAEQAGVSRPTIARLELGRSTNLSNLVRILRALDLVGNLEALVPEAAPSPMQQLRMQKKQRQRASTRGKETPVLPGGWSWEDES